MRASYDNRLGVAVLPRVRQGQLRSSKLRAWLARSELVDAGRPPEYLNWILGELGMPAPTRGLGALRLWGQTGDRPAGWIAASDPVYLEPMLDQLCIHAFRRGALPTSDLGPLVEHLQAAVGEGSPFRFVRVEGYAYLAGDTALASSHRSAAGLDGQTPRDFLPTGEGADRYRGFVSEIEMALHEHPVNLERQQRGLPPVNSMWIWGGGEVPEPSGKPHPPLFADDPLLRGYWLSNNAMQSPWPGDIRACLDASDEGLVAVAPDVDDGDCLEQWLSELKAALASGRLSSLKVLFCDGVVANVRRADAMRFWRRGNPLLDVPAHVS
jgi:hypothetical protein